MKTKNSYTEKDVRIIGLKILYSHNYMWTGKVKLDRRYNRNKAIMRFLRENALSESEKERITQLRRERVLNRKIKPFIKIKDNPMVKDYLNNKKDLKKVFDSHLWFYGNRNHWAKNEKDVKILKILMKYN